VPVERYPYQHEVLHHWFQAGCATCNDESLLARASWYYDKGEYYEKGETVRQNKAQDFGKQNVHASHYTACSATQMTAIKETSSEYHVDLIRVQVQQ